MFYEHEGVIYNLLTVTCVRKMEGRIIEIEYQRGGAKLCFKTHYDRDMAFETIKSRLSEFNIVPYRSEQGYSYLGTVGG